MNRHDLAHRKRLALALVSGLSWWTIVWAGTLLSDKFYDIPMLSHDLAELVPWTVIGDSWLETLFWYGTGVVFAALVLVPFVASERCRWQRSFVTLETVHYYDPFYPLDVWQDSTLTTLIGAVAALFLGTATSLVTGARFRWPRLALRLAIGGGVGGALIGLAAFSDIPDPLGLLMSAGHLLWQMLVCLALLTCEVERPAGHPPR
ncbi:MAG: hypothetical protein P8Y95_13235 [Gammaproteobacteria bacterium]